MNKEKEEATHSVAKSKVIFVLNNSKQLNCIVSSFFNVGEDLQS